MATQETKPVHVNVELLQFDAESVVGLCCQIIPEWKDQPHSSFQTKQFTTGLSNLLFRVRKGSCAVLCRIYGKGTDKLLDHDLEMNIIQQLIGFAPVIYGTFSNGYIYQYFDGVALDEKDLHSGKHSENIAKSIARLHAQEPPHIDKSVMVWTFIRRWLALIPDSSGDQKKDQWLCETLAPLTIKTLSQELESLEKMFPIQEYGLVFSHNDTLPQNFIYDEKTLTIRVIDYEYAGYNFEAFDIGNHWVEWAGPNQTLEYPNDQQKKEWIHFFLQAKGASEPVAESSESHILFKQANRCMVLSLFMWGVWGLYQAHFSDVEADFFEFSKGRWKKYFELKKLFFD